MPQGPHKLPFKRVKVVSTDFAVQTIPSSEVDPYAVAGTTGQSPQSPAIRIAAHTSLTGLADTVLHEILHACWSTMNLGPTEEEERAVSAMATALIAVMRDNPKLRTWLADACNK